MADVIEPLNHGSDFMNPLQVTGIFLFGLAVHDIFANCYGVKVSVRELSVSV